jgi:DNA-binding IscR family transcriptional regulator
MNTPETNRPRAAAAVWEHSHQTGARLLMLLALADLADDTGTVRVSPQTLATLAKKCRTNPTYALALLSELVASGELVVTDTATDGLSTYRITLMDGPASSASPRKP